MPGRWTGAETAKRHTDTPCDAPHDASSRLANVSSHLGIGDARCGKVCALVRCPMFFASWFSTASTWLGWNEKCTDVARFRTQPREVLKRKGWNCIFFSTCSLLGQIMSSARPSRSEIFDAPHSHGIWPWNHIEQHTAWAEHPLHLRCTNEF